MNYCYTIVIIILLSILIILCILSIIFESIYLSGDDKITNIIMNILVSDIIFTAIIIIINSYLIYTSLYYFSKIQMIIFLVVMLTFLLIKLCLLLLIIYNGNISFDFSFLNMSAFLIFAQIVILFATFIFGLFYRYQLNKDLEESPLNKVDEFMTEEMYRNIIRQSLNPNDISLKKDFEKQFEQRKAEIRQNSVVNTSI